MFLFINGYDKCWDLKQKIGIGIFGAGVFLNQESLIKLDYLSNLVYVVSLPIKNYVDLWVKVSHLTLDLAYLEFIWLSTYTEWLSIYGCDKMGGSAKSSRDP